MCTLKLLVFLSTETATSATASTATAATASARGAAHWLATSTAAIACAGATARLWPIVNEQRVERDGIGQDVVADIIATNGQRIQLLWLASLVQINLNIFINIFK